MVMRTPDFAVILRRTRPLMQALTQFAEAVTPTGRTYWGKPLTVAQLRADPFKDPAGAYEMGMGMKRAAARW